MPTIVVRTPPPLADAVDHGPFADVARPDRALVTVREALAIDACRAVQSSGSDLVVTVAPSDRADRADDRAVEAVESALDRGLETTPRVEPQVGSTPAARLGNTVTHLFETADASSVGVVFAGTIPARATLDQATIQLRTHDAVIGPAPGGRVGYLGLTAPIDFADALADPAVATLTERAVAAGHETTTIDPLIRAADGPSLDGTLAQIDARRTADDAVPETLAAWIEEWGPIDRPSD